MGPKKQEQAVASIVEALSKAFIDLQKASKLATKIGGMAEFACKSQKMTNDHQELVNRLEDAEKMCNNLGFICKFKKAQGGSCLDIELGNATLSEAAKVLQELMDSAKAVKAVLPKKEES